MPKIIKVHFKIVGRDCSFAHNFLVWPRMLIILIALESWWKILDFTSKIKWKTKKKSCQKWRWKNATHRNLMFFDMKVIYEFVAKSFTDPNTPSGSFSYKKFLRKCAKYRGRSSFLLLRVKIDIWSIVKRRFRL